MLTQKYMRKPFYVDAVELTEDNFEEVAKWCGGEILTEKQGRREVRYIKVPVNRPMSEKQTKAFVKDRLLHTVSGFKVYTETAFEDCFVKTDEELCGNAALTIDHKPCVLVKGHPKFVAHSSIKLEEQALFPSAYPKPSTR